MEINMKKLFTTFSLMIIAMNLLAFSFADTSTQDLEIKILSPKSVKDYPGHEDVIQVSLTNNSQNDLNDILTYITMADTLKNMTVNLEDYSADKPVHIDQLKTGETTIVALPIRFVYTSNYHLYVTVVSKDQFVIHSSDAIPIEILGNTQINKPLTMGVAISEPVVLLGVLGILYIMRNRKYSHK
jgi:hypothetical protein